MKYSIVFVAVTNGQFSNDTLLIAIKYYEKEIVSKVCANMVVDLFSFLILAFFLITTPLLLLLLLPIGAGGREI